MNVNINVLDYLEWLHEDLHEKTDLSCEIIMGMVLDQLSALSLFTGKFTVKEIDPEEVVMSTGEMLQEAIGIEINETTNHAREALDKIRSKYNLDIKE